MISIFGYCAIKNPLFMKILNYMIEHEIWCDMWAASLSFYWIGLLPNCCRAVIKLVFNIWDIASTYSASTTKPLQKSFWSRVGTVLKFFMADMKMVRILAVCEIFFLLFTKKAKNWFSQFFTHQGRENIYRRAD